MLFWKIFWSAFLILGLLAFVGLVVYVAAGGVQDIRAMLGSIKSRDGDRS
ncbi:MAG: hypothetical protein H6834_10870 [Planctomycetes bacterium]|nr:hypothetical protein [Planctomycetota bacterium]